jgi:glycerophosphoryl diester phosphodiesterase
MRARGGGNRVPRRVRSWLRRAERPYVLGHRGARRRAPENTLRAFDLAMDEGADGIELDVRLDRDGDVVVIHDPTLARVTGGRDPRRVEDVGRSELVAVDLGEGQHVPRLEEVLHWARRRSARVNVELKRDVSRRATLVYRVAGLVWSQPDAADWLILSSFDPRLVAFVSRLVPFVPAGWLVEEKGGIPGRSLWERLVGASALHPQASLVTETGILPWRTAHLPVNVWTVNEPDEARRLDALGVDALISDCPGEILAALGSR